MTETKQAPATRSLEEIEAELEQAQTTAKKIAAERESLAEQRRTLYDDDEAEVSQLVGGQLPARLRKRAREISERSEEMEIAGFLVARKMLELQAERTRALLERNAMERSEANARVNEIVTRQREVEQELVAAGNEAEHLRWHERTLREQLQEFENRLATLTRAGSER